MAKALKSRGNSWGFSSIIAIYLILIIFIIQIKIVRFEPIVKNTFLLQKIANTPSPKNLRGYFSFSERSPTPATLLVTARVALVALVALVVLVAPATRMDLSGWRGLPTVAKW